MCADLEKELKRGTQAAEQVARALIDHLESMAADRATIPVVVGGQEYTVTIQRGNSR